jgi:titin
VTPATVPVAPRSITALRRDQAAELSWDEPSNDGGDSITGYRLHVHRGDESPVSFLVSESPYTVRGLTNGAAYAVTVNAINSVGDSLASAPVVFTPATIPTPPSSISVQRRDSGADVSWTVPSNNGGDPITHYLVKVQDGNGHATNFSATESPFSIRGLNNGATYSVTVSAINSVGESGDSGQEVFTPATIPNPPSSISVQRRDSGAEVSWTVPSSNGGDAINGYRVNIRDGNNDVTTFDATESPFSIRALNNGTTYSVTVQSINSIGDSVASESGVVTPATVPTEPLAITVVRQNSGADVSWNAPSDDGGDPITKYRVNLSDGNDNVTSFVATESPFSIRGLNNGSAYSVTVNAFNSVGYSTESQSVVVTPATVPDQPMTLSAIGVDGGAELEWRESPMDGGDPITGYRIRVWREAVVLREFDTSNTNASVAGLANGVEYRITVSSINSVGESFSSTPAFVMPASTPAVEPPVVEPPIVEPPIVDPPIVDPPIVDPPPTVRLPSPPVAVSVISTSRKSITVGWRVNDSGDAPVTDFIVHTSRYKNRGFTVWPDGTSTTNRVQLRKPRRGSLYVRVIAVTDVGESAPSQVKRVAR